MNEDSATVLFVILALFGILAGGMGLHSCRDDAIDDARVTTCAKTCGYRTVAATGKASTALYCLCSEADGGVSTEVGK